MNRIVKTRNISPKRIAYTYFILYAEFLYKRNEYIVGSNEANMIPPKMTTGAYQMTYASTSVIIPTMTKHQLANR